MAGCCEHKMGSVRIWKYLGQQKDCLHWSGVLRKITKITQKVLEVSSPLLLKWQRSSLLMELSMRYGIV